MFKKKVLLNELGDEQKKKGFISKEKLKEISSQTCVPESKAYSAATFYSFLSMEKRAKHTIYVVNCPVSRLKGSEGLAKHLEKKLKVKLGHASKNKKFFLGETSCIGLCDRAPSVLVDGTPHHSMTKKKLDQLLVKLK